MACNLNFNLNNLHNSPPLSLSFCCFFFFFFQIITPSPSLSRTLFHRFFFLLLSFSFCFTKLNNKKLTYHTPLQILSYNFRIWLAIEVSDKPSTSPHSLNVPLKRVRFRVIQKWTPIVSSHTPNKNLRDKLKKKKRKEQENDSYK